MTRRGWWSLAILGVAAGALGLELWAAADGDPDTRTWTEHVITYLPWEVTAALVGALLLWLPLHFGIRYVRRRRRDRVG